jgi:DNA-binding transcriptional ArsR family regulator
VALDPLRAVLSDPKAELILSSLVRKRSATLAELATIAGLEPDAAKVALEQLVGAQLVEIAAPVYYPTEAGFRMERQLRSARTKL